jgi:endonuclease/exonuclease/phosphatase family metal-dependent hydrolase
VAVSCTHLGNGLAFLRRRQHRAFFDALEHVDLPQMLCGDFNLHTREADRRGFDTLTRLAEEGFRDSFVEVHGQRRADRMVTVDRRNPLVRQPQHKRIDYVWLRSRGDVRFKVREAKVAIDHPSEGLFPSDHYGVIVRVAVAGTER